MFDFADRPPLDLGEITATPAVMAALAAANVSVYSLLISHAAGDWGDADDEERELNHRAIVAGSGLVTSVYRLATGAVLFIVTDLDRQETSVLLAEEY